MRTSRKYALLLLALTAIAPGAASAQQAASCGAPEPANLPTEPSGGPYCDFFQRQFAYREQSLKHREQLKQRQEAFAAQRNVVIERYRQDLEALNKIRGEEFQAQREAAQNAPDLSVHEEELQDVIKAEESAQSPL